MVWGGRFLSVTVMILLAHIAYVAMPSWSHSYSRPSSLGLLVCHFWKLSPSLLVACIVTAKCKHHLPCHTFRPSLLALSLAITLSRTVIAAPVAAALQLPALDARAPLWHILLSQLLVITSRWSTGCHFCYWQCLYLLFRLALLLTRSSSPLCPPPPKKQKCNRNWINHASKGTLCLLPWLLHWVLTLPRI